MVHGKRGLYLEAWKFGVYLSMPIVASVYYSNPETQRYWADYWQYIKYPENPNTNVKEQIQQLVQQKELQREQRLAYQEQLLRLQNAAERASNMQPEESHNESSPPWWRRAGRWIIGSTKEDSK
jgi:hypothetical protein